MIYFNPGWFNGLLLSLGARISPFYSNPALKEGGCVRMFLAPLESQLLESPAHVPESPLLTEANVSSLRLDSESLCWTKGWENSREQCSQLRRWVGRRSQRREKSRGWERRGGPVILRRTGLAQPFQFLFWPETKDPWHILKENKISKLYQLVYGPSSKHQGFLPWDSQVSLAMALIKNIKKNEKKEMHSS